MRWWRINFGRVHGSNVMSPGIFFLVVGKWVNLDHPKLRSIISYHITSYQIASYHIKSHHITSNIFHITSNRIISHQIYFISHLCGWCRCPSKKNPPLRMRSEGFSFYIWGVWGLTRVRVTRLLVSATVRARPS